MFRSTLFITMALLLGMTLTSCASGGKKTANTKTSDTVGSEITDAPPPSLSFSSLGSDSEEIPGLRTITFSYDQANLSTEARKTLAENADWIQSQESILIQVEGHCDNRGSIEYNLSLGERRASAVHDYLVSLGVDPSRLSTISYGKEKPLDTSLSEEALARNRRANFVPMAQ